ncbi:MAG: hypothetical protein ACM359_00365 [Bacillota bacterium]
MGLNELSASDRQKAVQDAWDNYVRLRDANTPSAEVAATKDNPPSCVLDPAKMTDKQFAAVFLPKVPGSPLA